MIWGFYLFSYLLSALPKDWRESMNESPDLFIPNLLFLQKQFGGDFDIK